MYFSTPLLAILLLIFTTALSALNTTTTAKAYIITCDKQAQCLTTQFCNIKQRVCMLKYPVTSTCYNDIECAGGKCDDYICRQPCKSDNDCSLTKEYCTISKYCTAKYCGLCIRDAQCANNDCGFFYCASSDCTTALNILNKQA